MKISVVIWTFLSVGIGLSPGWALGATQVSVSSSAQRALLGEFAEALSKNDLKRAAEVAKKHPYPDLALGRVLYQSKDFLGAAAAYEKIAKTSLAYGRSRQELGWAYLRSGQHEKLRGLLLHLNTPLVPLENRLEGRVLAAYQNLLFCEDQSAQNEISKFQEELREYLKSDAQAVSDSTMRTRPFLQKQINEAIEKMKFVRFEVDHQIYQAQKAKGKGESLAQRQWLEPAAIAPTLSPEVSRLSFPVHRELWSDEVFAVVGQGEGLCEKGAM